MYSTFCIYAVFLSFQFSNTVSYFLRYNWLQIEMNPSSIHQFIKIIQNSPMDYVSAHEEDEFEWYFRSHGGIFFWVEQEDYLASFSDTEFFDHV